MTVISESDNYITQMQVHNVSAVKANPIRDLKYQGNKSLGDKCLQL